MADRQPQVPSKRSVQDSSLDEDNASLDIVAGHNIKSVSLSLIKQF